MLLLLILSIAAQVLYLELDVLKSAAQITLGALDEVPIIGWLVGNNGGGWVVLGRAIGFHVAEAACCFVLAKSTENPEKRMLARQREQRALLEVQRFERIAALERRIFEHAFAAFDQVEQQLGGPVQVQALPAAGQTGKTAQGTKPKRTAAKALRRSFRHLTPAKPQKARGAAMGTIPFAPSVKLPDGTHAKLPKPHLSAEERLRRLEEAIVFLRQHLADGPQPANTVLQAAKSAGIADRTLHRAKDVLGVTTEHTGWHGQWIWRPSAAMSSSSQAAMLQTSRQLGRTGSGCSLGELPLPPMAAWNKSFPSCHRSHQVSTEWW